MWDIILDVLLDSLKDSLIVFAVALIFHISLSFFEDKLSKRLGKKHKTAPLFGSLVGLVPQCGISVVASDLYVKEHITVGTLMAIFVACSDEALPIMFANPSHIVETLILIISKFILGFILGFTVDLIARKSQERVIDHHHHCHHEEEIHVGCCNHEIDNEEEKGVHKHLIHPLVHSLKLFGYVLIINFAFGLLLAFIGEDKIMSFLSSNSLLAPLFTVLIGLIPNCASSVIITELFLLGGINFGACLGGLSINAGLGIFYLMKEEHNKKKVLLIISILIAYALIIGYVGSLICSLI